MVINLFINPTNKQPKKRNLSKYIQKYMNS